MDRCGAALAEGLTAIGGRVERLPREHAGDHLLAEFGWGDASAPIGHFDTVWPVGQLARMPMVIRDGCLYGPGTFDMKAGIAIAMLASRALEEVGPRPDLRVVMLWTTDEETGSLASRAAIDEEARRSEAVLVLEPSLPGGALKTARKGGGRYRLVVHGRAAHAGIDPLGGASAIHELARLIIKVRQLQDSDPRGPGERRSHRGRVCSERRRRARGSHRRRPGRVARRRSAGRSGLFGAGTRTARNLDSD